MNTINPAYRTKVLVIAAERRTVDPESPAALLRGLGCEVRRLAFDSTGSEEVEMYGAPHLILVDARERLEAAYASLDRLRERARFDGVPAIFAVEEEQVAMLDDGAVDDFIVSPLAPAELHRRMQRLDVSAGRVASAATRVTIGDLEIDFRAYEVHLRGQTVALTLQEFKLLGFLAQNPGRAWTRDELISNVWGYRHADSSRTVDIHVRRLRAKLGSPAAELIETVRGIGYKIRERAEA
jgi:DNA-binding response OmpR family regulator